MQGGSTKQRAQELEARGAPRGDSRLDALLDILSDQRSDDPARAFIVVCGDNPTIDMLCAVLPSYFPDLADAISVLRRPATTDVDGVTNLQCADLRLGLMCGSTGSPALGEIVVPAFDILITGFGNQPAQ